MSLESFGLRRLLSAVRQGISSNVNGRHGFSSPPICEAQSGPTDGVEPRRRAMKPKVRIKACLNINPSRLPALPTASANLARRVAKLPSRYAWPLKCPTSFASMVPPETYFKPTIQALVDRDLALVPILHDRNLLTAKIIEIISILEADPAVFAHPGDLQAVTVLCKIFLSVQKRRPGFARRSSAIDPVEVDDVMRILLSSFSRDVLQHCLINKIALAFEIQGGEERTYSTTSTRGRPH